MKVEKLILWIALIAILLAIPLTLILRNRSHTIGVQKQENHTLEVELQKTQKSLDTKKSEADQKAKEAQDLQQKNQDLDKQLQSKREAQSSIASTQPAPPPAVANNGASNSGGNCEAYRGIVAQYAWDVNTALAIMKAESMCNPNAASPTDDHGLMQIHNGLAIYGSKIYDPAFNISIAFSTKYAASGWHPWSTFNSGAYLKYL